MGKWMDGLRSPKSPYPYATEPTKPPLGQVEGGFVGFVAPLTGDFGESEGERNDLWPRLQVAAERCGDYWGDGPERRAEMLESLRSMPVGWQRGWLEHLEASYGRA